jgi:hypothetical protein
MPTFRATFVQSALFRGKHRKIYGLPNGDREITTSIRWVAMTPLPSFAIFLRISKPPWLILPSQVSRTNNMRGMGCQGDADPLIRDAQNPTLEVVPTPAIICS